MAECSDLLMLTKKRRQTSHQSPKERNTTFLPLMLYRATTEAMLTDYRSLTKTKYSLQVKQGPRRGTFVWHSGWSNLPLISLLARRSARASKSLPPQKITQTDIFSHCGSRKTTACTENKFSNCFQFLLFHWLRCNPAALHSRSLQLSFFPHSSSTSFLELLRPSRSCTSRPAGDVSEHASAEAAQHNTCPAMMTYRNVKLHSLCHFLGSTKYRSSCIGLYTKLHSIIDAFETSYRKIQLWCHYLRGL